MGNVTLEIVAGYEVIKGFNLTRYGNKTNLLDIRVGGGEYCRYSRSSVDQPTLLEFHPTTARITAETAITIEVCYARTSHRG